MFTPKELQLLDRVATELFLSTIKGSQGIDAAQVACNCYKTSQAFLEGRKQYFKEQKLVGIT
jgi:hypothetical protein